MTHSELLSLLYKHACSEHPWGKPVLSKKLGVLLVSQQWQLIKLGKVVLCCDNTTANCIQIYLKVSKTSEFGFRRKSLIASVNALMITGPHTGTEDKDGRQ